MTGAAIDSFLITCEHGGNRIPTPYETLFRGRRALLNSHHGYDPGALVMARTLAKAFRATLVTSTISRLVIDLSRSIGHPQLFSAATHGRRLIHISSHSFTPEWDGRVRRADVGLL